MPPAATLVTSRSNARVKQLRAAFAGQARLSSGLIAIEGDHMVEEALRSGQMLKTIFVAEHRAVPGYAPAGVELIRLTDEVFESCMETRSPQGVAALLIPPVASVAAMLRGARPLLLIAVGLQDPGNLGTLVRSAEAFGAAGVLTTRGSVSAWNGKAVRASAGSVFRMPVGEADEEALRLLEEHGVRLIAAVKSEGALVFEADLTGACALLVGNEGAGLSEEWLRRAHGSVTIPCPGAVESLNAAVAGSILLYEASRQRAAAR